MITCLPSQKSLESRLWLCQFIVQVIRVTPLKIQRHILISKPNAEDVTYLFILPEIVYNTSNISAEKGIER